MPAPDPFRGRVAVITGGAGGIGFAMAEAFAARGARIVLADLDEAGMAQRAKALAANGAEVLCVPTDVTLRESVASLTPPGSASAQRTWSATTRESRSPARSCR